MTWPSQENLRVIDGHFATTGLWPQTPLGYWLAKVNDAVLPARLSIADLTDGTHVLKNGDALVFSRRSPEKVVRRVRQLIVELEACRTHFSNTKLPALEQSKGADLEKASTPRSGASALGL